MFRYKNNSFSTRHAELVSASVGCKDLEFGSIPSKTLKQVQGDGLIVQGDELVVQDDKLLVQGDELEVNNDDTLKIDSDELRVKFNKPNTKLNPSISNSTTSNLLNKNNKLTTIKTSKKPNLSTINFAFHKLNKPKHHFAFTLAEVMIVLTIIGILVAILLPSSRHITPDKVLMHFKKNNVALINAIRNLVNSDTYFYNGDFGMDKNGNRVDNPKYFCSALADILLSKEVNCSEDNLGYNSSALANLPDMLSYEFEGEKLADWADCMCKNNLSSGEEIILSDDSIIYTINPYYHFGSLVDGSDKRLFNLCSEEKRYKFICLDIDGLNKGEDPFGYALRADGKLILGSRAQIWSKLDINKKEDEEIEISSIDNCEPVELAITPENDTCVAPPSVSYPSGGGGSAPQVCVPSAHCVTCDNSTNLCIACESGYELSDGVCNEIPTELLFTFDGSYSELESTAGGQKIFLKSDGTFIPSTTIKGTIFLIGGGGGGYMDGYGDAGGGGGGYPSETLFTFIKDQEYEVTIGAGGSTHGGGGGTTKFNTLEALGGSGGYKTSGGSGGAAGGNSGGSGGSGTQFDGTYYGGGGGGCRGSGGAGGGGRGGTGEGSNGIAGTVNTGGGGGGACSWSGGGGGVGGSGVVIILIDPPDEE